MRIAQPVALPKRTIPAAVPRRQRLGRWLRRIVLGGLVLLLALGGAIWGAGRWAKANLRQRYPPPGKLIDVGGYKLHLACRGQGRSTVILEAGLNDFSVQWARVQPAVAQFTRVCAYDRAGLGWSEPSPHPRTRAVMVDELHTLLQNAGETGPYLLVGHSFGGITMRDFAQRYPARVVGLVLVDSAHEAQSVRIPALRSAAVQLLDQFRLFAVLDAWGVLALAPTQIPNRGLPPAALAQYRARLAATAYFDAALAESAAFYALGEAASPADSASLGDLPLIVLSRGQAAPLPGVSETAQAEVERTWRALQGALAALSTHSHQQIAKDSGHDIHLEQPELVIAAIHRLVQGQ